MVDLDRKQIGKEVTIDGREVTLVDYIDIEVPTQKQRVRITITRKNTYDPMKRKIIKDQVVHRARYCLNTVRKNDKQGDKEGASTF